MNNTRILSSGISDELKAWNRAESPLVTYARSLRMEGPDDQSGSAPAKASDPPAGDDKPSLLKDIDLDSVPEDVRNLLLEREKEYISNYTERQRIDAERQQAIELAGKHQSRADRFHGILQAHNLDPQAKPPGKKDENLYETELASAFMEDGVKPEHAKVYAKMFAKVVPIAARHASAGLATSLAPVVAIVGDLKADQALAEARSETNDPDGILNNPEVLAKVTENLKYLAQSGSPIDLGVIQSIKYMAYGELMSKNPDAMKSSKPTAVQTRLRGMGGGTPSTPRGGNGTVPVAVNDDTARAVNATTALMLKGLNIKQK